MAYFNKFSYFCTRHNISKILRYVKSDKKYFKCFKSNEGRMKVLLIRAAERVVDSIHYSQLLGIVAIKLQLIIKEN